MDEEKNLDWQQAKKYDEDMLNYGKFKTANENKKNSVQKNNNSINNNTINNDISTKDNKSPDNEEYEDYEDEESASKLGIISIAFLAILLFILGIFIGNKLLEIDEKATPSYVSKDVSERRSEESEIKANAKNSIEEDFLIDEDDEEDEEDEEEAPIIYARYNLESSNDINKDCTVSFGKEKNFSISLGKNDAYIYGEYHIDGSIITCNSITWRNAEKQEAINSTIKFRIIDKDEVQISEVNIYDGNEGLDKELINLDGLRVGLTYVWTKGRSLKSNF